MLIVVAGQASASIMPVSMGRMEKSSFVVEEIPHSKGRYKPPASVGSPPMHSVHKKVTVHGTCRCVMPRGIAQRMPLRPAFKILIAHSSSINLTEDVGNGPTVRVPETAMWPAPVVKAVLTSLIVLVDIAVQLTLGAI